MFYGSSKRSYTNKGRGIQATVHVAKVTFCIALTEYLIIQNPPPYSYFMSLHCLKGLFNDPQLMSPCIQQYYLPSIVILL